MLLEQSNTQITQFFKEGTHFVSFDNEQDLLEKILYYLKHETKRIKIASAGQEKAVKLIANYDIFKYLKVNYG
jgi:spore maturation protein CgeB